MVGKAAVLGCALVGLVLLGSAQAGDKGLDAKGQVKVGLHNVKMVSGALYRVEAEGKNFRPRVVIGEGPDIQFYQPNYGKKNAFSGFTVVPETRDYRVLIVPDVLDPIGAGGLDYTLRISARPLEAKPVLSVADKWTDK